MSDTVERSNIKKRGNREALPLATERALLLVLLDPRQSGLRFKTVCDKQTDLFGTPGSELRLKVQKRRNYLRNNQDAFAYSVGTVLPELVSPPPPITVSSPQPTYSTPSSVPSSKPALLSPSPSRIISTPSHLKFSTPRKKMAPRRDEDDDSVPDGGSFSLSIDKPWNNPFGMLVVKGTEVEESNTVVDKLTIMKPIFDYTDYEKKLFSAKLCDDGGGIVVTEPTIPGFLWQNPKEIQKLVDDTEREAMVCQPSYRTFKTIRTQMTKDRKTRTKEVVYRFPRGVTCNNEFFNSENRRSSQLDLDTEVIVHEVVFAEDQTTGLTVKQYCIVLVWKVAIDGEGKKTAVDDDAVKGAAKMFARLGLKKKDAPGTRLDQEPPSVVHDDQHADVLDDAMEEEDNWNDFYEADSGNVDGQENGNVEQVDPLRAPLPPSPPVAEPLPQSPPAAAAAAQDPVGAEAAHEEIASTETSTVISDFLSHLGKRDTTKSENQKKATGKKRIVEVDRMFLEQNQAGDLAFIRKKQQAVDLASTNDDGENLALL